MHRLVIVILLGLTWLSQGCVRALSSRHDTDGAELVRPDLGRSDLDPQADLAADLQTETAPNLDSNALADAPAEGTALCQGGSTWTTISQGQPDDEYAFAVPAPLASCTFSFVVKGGGGGSSGDSNGGDGGQNSFDFVPGEAGVFRIVVGGGGLDALGGAGASGAGASSVTFDPASDTTRADAYVLSVAGGGGGSGSSEVNERGGRGAGDGAGEDATGVAGTLGNELGTGAPGDGSGGIAAAADDGGSCTAPCQGGPGGAAVNAAGGFGKGAGYGGSYVHGGGGGGGYGGGAASRYDNPGAGGAGKVFDVSSPATLVNTTTPAGGLGGGGRAGQKDGDRNGEVGSVALTIH